MARAPAMKAANMVDPLDRADLYLFVVAQAHRVADEFTRHQWREHPAISGAINYRLLASLLPYTSINCCRIR